MTPAGPWPFSARRAELAAALSAARSGRPVVIHGHHGAGRTRLVQEVARRSRERGPVTAVRAGSGESGTGLVDLLDNDAPLTPAAQLESLLPSRRGGLLLVDDAHLLAPAQQQEALAAGGVMLTVPTAHLGAADAEHVGLGALTPAAVSTLLHRALGAPVDGRAAALLTRQSRGLVGPLVELTRGSQQAGVLRNDSGAWVLTGDPEPTPLFSDWVTAELARLSPGCLPGLAALVLAEGLPVGWLDAQLPAPCAEALRTCPLVDGPETVRFRSPVVARLVADRLPRLTLRRAARMLLDPQAPAMAADPTTTARCRALAGLAPHPRDALPAASTLLADHQPEEAQELLERCLQANDILDLRLTLAALHLHRGAPAAASDVLPDNPRAAPLRTALHILAGLPGGAATAGPRPGRVLDDPGLDALDPGPALAAPAEPLRDPWPAPQVQRAVAWAEAGQLLRAREAARSEYARALETGWLPDHAWAAVALAWVALCVGLPRTALRRAHEADRAMAAMGWHGVRPLTRDLASVALAWLGTPGPTPQRNEPAALLEWADLWATRSRAWHLAAAGSPGPAVECVRSGLERARARGAVHTASALVGDLRRVGEGTVTADCLRIALALPTTPALELELAAARAQRHGEVAGLRTAAGGFAAGGMPLRAAECLMAAARLLPPASAGAAAALTDEAQQAAIPCEGAATPLLALPRSVTPLTSREREVAALAAAGSASGDIAERLGISRRTVDNLLGRAYTKLGVTGRRDLAQALGPLGRLA